MESNYSLFIGRWQPFHNGHKKLIDRVLQEGWSVIIAIRDTPISKDNPYTVLERKEMIRDAYEDLIKQGRVKIITIPDIREICIGRKVGYGIREIHLDKKTEKVSGTAIRSDRRRLLWLTGNSGSGKTTLAYILKDRLQNSVILDGDEMRASISLGAGFSKEAREEHNLRVARLAKVLYEQGNSVIISVIAPFAFTRQKIEEIIKPLWFYVKRDLPEDKEKPYEPPTEPDLIVDTDRYSINQCVEQVWELIK